jgi:hypothetical protein
MSLYEDINKDIRRQNKIDSDYAPVNIMMFNGNAWTVKRTQSIISS